MHLTGHESLKEVRTQVASGEQVYISASSLSVFLNLFIQKQLAADAIQQIADVLECEAVVYEESKAGLIAQVLFELSSPEINGILTEQRILELIENLGYAHLSSSTISSR